MDVLGKDHDRSRPVLDGRLEPVDPLERGVLERGVLDRTFEIFTVTGPIPVCSGRSGR